VIDEDGEMSVWKIERRATMRERLQKEARGRDGHNVIAFAVPEKYVPEAKIGRLKSPGMRFDRSFVACGTGALPQVLRQCAG
jgi:hypothetical protein